MPGAWRLGLATVLVLAACTRGSRSAPEPPDSRTAREIERIRAEARPRIDVPRTRAERTRYRETSSHADVVAFVDSLAALSAVVHVGELGRSGDGRLLPLVTASRPAVRTPDEARALGRPVVYVQGNIHGGEVEGKEALLALLRDLALGPQPNVLDSIVLVAVPIYNADGNERLAPQAANRSEQNGPAMIGERANAQGFDLNRDYMKAEAPETRASLAMLAAWQPDVFVDLHTTDGSYHGYALTYAPPLHPASPLGPWTQDTLLPELQRRMQARHGMATFPYGNFSLDYGIDVTPDTVKQGWYSYDHRPRFGTNYVGLRGSVAILSEAYSHDPFERRVRSTYAFVGEVLSLAAERGAELRQRTARAREAIAVSAEPGVGAGVDFPIRARLTDRPAVGEVVAEDLARVADSALTEPGVPRGLRRTGRYRTLRIPVYDRFVPTLARRIPAGGWALDPAQREAVRRLRLHGVRVDSLDAPVQADAEVFAIDSVVVAPRAFQGHREVRLVGRHQGERRRLEAGSWIVPGDQPLALVALELLDPESDDGLTAWNVFDESLGAGASFPVVRLLAPVGARRPSIP